MRAALAIFVLLLATTTASATVWTSKLAVNGKQQTLVAIGEKPSDLFPACRCVVGTWSLGKNGETATGFSGKLVDLAFNYKRTGKAATSLTLRIRKTRDVMGVHKDHRAALHGILRGTGHLILREMKGGDYEVAAYATGPINKLFTTYKTWRAPEDKPPALTDPSAVIDPAADAVALAKLINDYRASIKLPRIAISPKLTKVAEAHVRDLNVNKPETDSCNMHSWSKQKGWTGCCYDSSKEAAKCMWVKPKEIAGYSSNGYEIAANASGITPAKALELWQKSQAHHVVMINKDKWTKPWGAMGVAISGDYAVAWFGELADK
jgi:Cysteine-rich secretory protein family